MKRPKITTRRLMIAVVLLGVAMGLGFPAARIFLDPEFHHHTRLVVSPDRSERFLSLVFVPSPYWPRYVRYIQGRPWRKQHFRRVEEDDSTQEECEFSHPEIIQRHPNGAIARIGLSPRQAAEFEEVRMQNPSAMAYELNHRPIP